MRDREGRSEKRGVKKGKGDEREQEWRKRPGKGGRRSGKGRGKGMEEFCVVVIFP